MSSADVSFLRNFDRIYIEKDAVDYPLTSKILEHFKSAKLTYIRHYKDIFNRSRQSFEFQSHSRKIILAVNRGKLVYEGAPVCHNYGNDRFFYTSTVLNCPYDCEYCFLKGRYSTANIVIFVNVEDYIAKASELGECYLSVSFDTDLPAMDHITAISSVWAELAQEHPEITIEIRTKSAPKSFIALPNLVYAFTLSPQEIIDRFEHGTAGLEARLRSLRLALSKGCKVRVCVDPIIYIDNWKELYGRMIDRLIAECDVDKINDYGIGAFRISSEYIKAIRRAEAYSAAVQFPFENRDGYCEYPYELTKAMVDYVRDRIREVADDGKIFCQY